MKLPAATRSSTVLPCICVSFVQYRYAQAHLLVQSRRLIRNFLKWRTGANVPCSRLLEANILRSCQMDCALPVTGTDGTSRSRLLSQMQERYAASLTTPSNFDVSKASARVPMHMTGTAVHCW